MNCPFYLLFTLLAIEWSSVNTRIPQFLLFPFIFFFPFAFFPLVLVFPLVLGFFVRPSGVSKFPSKSTPWRRPLVSSSPREVIVNRSLSWLGRPRDRFVGKRIIRSSSKRSLSMRASALFRFRSLEIS